MNQGGRAIHRQSERRERKQRDPEIGPRNAATRRTSVVKGVGERSGIWFDFRDNYLNLDFSPS
jgi:hypothetical protein